MTFEISMTHKFDKELTDIDKAHINLGVISLDFITLVCERDGVTKVFDLPFNACSSSKNEDGDIEVHIEDYEPDESNTDEFNWSWAPYIKYAYHGGMYYFENSKNLGFIDIYDKIYDYLSDKYGCAGHHFTDCVIYNEDTGEELPIPDIIPG